MPLLVETHFYGNVFVVEGAGRIVAGDELKVLEAALESGFREFSRFVLRLNQVDRLDSTGMGMLVRYAARARHRGGDLRLAEPPAFVANLLVMTKLSTVLRTYPTVDEAMLSFVRKAGDIELPEQRGPRVLVVDQSPDLCAFVRGVLSEHGFDVKSTNRFHDAKVMLQVDEVEYILLGPEASKHLPATALESLKTFAPLASAMQLDSNFKVRDAQEAGNTLLRMFRVRTS